MLYMKCGVNSSLRSSGCCRRCVAPWITVLSWHTEFTKRVIYKFTFLWFCETRHHTQAHVTSGALMHCALSLAVRRTQMAAQLCWWFRWPMFVMATLESQNILCTRTWSFNQSGVGAVLALSSFLNQILHQKEPEITVAYI